MGFRATTHRLATGFAVTGFVRNLPDGSVELVAGGDAEELDRFLAAVAREFASKIRQTEISPILPEWGEHSGFSIRS